MYMLLTVKITQKERCTVCGGNLPVGPPCPLFLVLSLFHSFSLLLSYTHATYQSFVRENHPRIISPICKGKSRTNF